MIYIYIYKTMKYGKIKNNLDTTARKNNKNQLNVTNY